MRGRGAEFERAALAPACGRRRSWPWCAPICRPASFAARWPSARTPPARTAISRGPWRCTPGCCTWEAKALSPCGCSMPHLQPPQTMLRCVRRARASRMAMARSGRMLVAGPARMAPYAPRRPAPMVRSWRRPRSRMAGAAPWRAAAAVEGAKAALAAKRASVRLPARRLVRTVIVRRRPALPRSKFDGASPLQPQLSGDRVHCALRGKRPGSMVQLSRPCSASAAGAAAVAQGLLSHGQARADDAPALGIDAPPGPRGGPVSDASGAPRRHSRPQARTMSRSHRAGDHAAARRHRPPAWCPPIRLRARAATDLVLRARRCVRPCR